MATIALDVAGRIDVVDAREQITLVCGTNVTAGLMYRADTNGAAAVALATAASNGAGARLALRTAVVGEACTFLKKGFVDGFNVASQTIGTQLFVSDTGTVADTAGTASISVGRIVPGNAVDYTATVKDKLVEVDLPE